MSTIQLSQSTLALIKTALQSPGQNNANYLNAYTAIYNDIKNQPGVDPGTVNWFSQAGLVNTQLFTPTAAGTWIHGYMFAAAQSQGVTLNDTIFQQVSNTIATTVFDELTTSNGVFDTATFSPTGIVKVDAGSGIGLIQSMFPDAHLDYSIWAGTLFTPTILNDSTYYSDYNLDTSSPYTKDCQTIDAGLEGALASEAQYTWNNKNTLGTNLGTAANLDLQTVLACMFGARNLVSPEDGVFVADGTDGDANLTPEWSNIINTDTDLVTNIGNATSVTNDVSELQQEFGVRQIDGAFGLTLDGNSIAELVTGGNQVYSADLTGVNSIYDEAGGNNLNVSSSGIQVTSNGDTIAVKQGSQMALSGNNNTINGGASDTLTLDGQGNTVNASSSTLSVAGGGQATVNGGGNTIGVDSGASITVSATDNNTIMNGVSGQTISVSGGTISVSGTSDSITAGATNQIAVNADGSQTVTVLDSNGAKTESVAIGADGSTTDSFYDPTTGNLTSQNVSGPGGTTSAWFKYWYDEYSGELEEIDAYSGGTVIGEAEVQWQNGAVSGFNATGNGNSLTVNNLPISLNGTMALAGTGDTVSGAIFTFESSGTTLTAKEATVVLAGTGDLITTEGSTLTLDAGVGVTVTQQPLPNGMTSSTEIYAAAGNAVALESGNYSINASGDSAGGFTTDREATGITLGSGVQAYITGSGNAITTAGGNSISASSNEIAVLSAGTNPQSVTTITGSNNTVDAQEGANLYFQGSGNQVTGNGLTISTEYEYYSLQLGSGTSATFTGNDQLTAAANDAITLASGSYTVIATGLSGGTASDGQATGIALDQSVQATVTGSGNAIGAAGNNTLTASGDLITLTGNGTSITGDGNTISATGISVAWVEGNNNTLTGGNDTITGGGGSSSGPLALEGNGYVIRSLGSFYTLSAGSSATVAFGSNSVIAAAGASVTVDTATNEGMGEGLDVTVIETNGGVAITLNSGANVDVDGSGNTITAVGSDDMYATGDTIVLSGSGTGISGDGNTIQAADGLTVYLGGGGGPSSNGELLSGNDETLSCNYAGVTLLGTGAIVTAMSSTVTLQSGESAIVSGNSTINTVAGDALTVNFLSSYYATAVINANNVVAGSLTRDGKATGITLGVQAQATVTGSGNTITALGSNIITASNDTLLASGSGNVITGNSDTIQFGTGATGMQIKGSGETLVLSGSSTLASLTASAASSGSDLVLSDSATGSQITLTDMLSQIGAGTQEVKLANGTVLSALQLVDMETTGTSGNDTLYGWAAGGNTFDGKGGNDVEIGHGNGDTFIFNQGYGSLEINESDASATPDNVLKLGAGITASSLALSTQNGSDLLISDGVTGDEIKLDGMLTSTSSGIQTIQFADGTSLTRAQLLAMPVNVNGSAGVSQTLTGTSGDNVFDSHGGNDVENGAGGNDTYVLQPGYSGITINNGVSTSNAALGDLQLGDVNPDNIWLKQVGNNLQVSIMGSTTEATIDNWFSNTYNQLSEVTVAGGSSGSLTLDSQVNQLIQAMATFSASNSGFDITSPTNATMTDTTLLAAVNHAWHH